MKFHPTKCKVLSLSFKHPNYYILHFDRFSYELGNNVLDYCCEEKDLGIIITPKISWDMQYNSIVTKASRQLVLLIIHVISSETKTRKEPFILL